MRTGKQDAQASEMHDHAHCMLAFQAARGPPGQDAMLQAGTKPAWSARGAPEAIARQSLCMAVLHELTVQRTVRSPSKRRPWRVWRE